jgi:hypothetical protein
MRAAGAAITGGAPPAGCHCGACRVTRWPPWVLLQSLPWVAPNRGLVWLPSANAAIPTPTSSIRSVGIQHHAPALDRAWARIWSLDVAAHPVRPCRLVPVLSAQQRALKHQEQCGAESLWILCCRCALDRRRCRRPPSMVRAAPRVGARLATCWCWARMRRTGRWRALDRRRGSLWCQLSIRLMGGVNLVDR